MVILEDLAAPGGEEETHHLPSTTQEWETVSSQLPHWKTVNLNIARIPTTEPFVSPPLHAAAPWAATTPPTSTLGKASPPGATPSPSNRPSLNASFGNIRLTQILQGTGQVLSASYPTTISGYSVNARFEGRQTFPGDDPCNIGPSNYNNVLSEYGAGANAYCSQVTNRVALANPQALFFQADVSGGDNPTETGSVLGPRYYLNYARTAPFLNCGAYGLSI
ncbi:hypothetical protein MMC11_003887 [Xylographa trunciseda]|nr:hypothetical protein [Xylographa trunciseda]